MITNCKLLKPKIINLIIRIFLCSDVPILILCHYTIFRFNSFNSNFEWYENGRTVIQEYDRIKETEFWKIH